jgi:peptidoglycan LD-endopeptidase LytH
MPSQRHAAVRPYRSRDNRRGARLCIAAGVTIVLGLGLWAITRTEPSATPASPAPPVSAPTNAPPSPPPEPFKQVVFPTDQQDLLDRSRPGVFQPTAAGTGESALYGSVRTAKRGQALGPSFHEGIDIAPTRRDRRGAPLDTVYAVAQGSVAYINRAPGNSNYGNYVVLLHPDPVGGIYTLYAHLAAVAPGLQAGARVQPGTVLGTMGHTPSGIIPLARAHTHFEIGLVGNAHFADWFRRQRLKPDHGAYNGWNLLAINPLDVFARQHSDPRFTFRAHLAQTPRAFELVIAAPRQLDFFRRYPQLWQGGDYMGGGLVMACSENGVPLEGRAATAEEVRRLGRRKATVLKVDERVLGRNGARLVARDKNGWRLGQSGERWLDILSWPP